MFWKILFSNKLDLYDATCSITLLYVIMEQHTLKYVNYCLNLYLNVIHFLTPVLIRHLWQLETVVFLHWCLLCAILLRKIDHCATNIFFSERTSSSMSSYKPSSRNEFDRVDVCLSSSDQVPVGATTFCLTTLGIMALSLHDARH